MKGWHIGVIGVVVLVFIIAFTSFNGLVSADEDANVAWGNVESAYQRRSDLIPNLVEVVKGAAAHEITAISAVADARAKIGSLQIDPKNAEQFKDFAEKQQMVSSSLSRLMMVVENYPNLKATQSFSDLQSQLEGTENRINVERVRYNEAVGKVNKKVRKFPSSLFAGMADVSKRESFKSDEGASKAPEVKL